DDREIDALDPRPEGEEAEHEGKQARHQHDQQSGVPEPVGESPVPGVRLPVEEHHEVGEIAVIDAVMANRAHQVHPHRVAAEREEETVSEREDAGVAPDQVEREGDDCVAHDLANKRDKVIGEVQRMRRGQEEVRRRDHDEHDVGGDHERDPAGPRQQRAPRRLHVRTELDGKRRVQVQPSAMRPRRAKSPCGRFWMKTMMNTRTAIFASTAPDHASTSLLTIPRPSAAYTVPASCPTPPSTTTMNESTM